MEASERARVDPAEKAGLFPFPAARKGQDQFLENARECVMNRIHLLAHAPTGLGKTAVSLAAGLETTLEENGFLLFLTSRQSQHFAAIETLKRIDGLRKVGVVDMIAKEDMCLARRENGGAPCVESGECYFLRGAYEDVAEALMSHPLHVQELIQLCLRDGACPYLAALRALKTADVAVCDYNHVFGFGGRPLLEMTGRREAETVVIVDEGHNLPGRIMENNSAVLTESSIRLAASSKCLRDFRADMDVLMKKLDSLTSGPNRESFLEPEDLDDYLRSDCGTDSRGLAEEMRETLERQEVVKHRELIDFLALWGKYGSSSMRFAQSRPREIRVRLMEPSLVSRPILERIRSGIVMSGTLHPPEMYADLLGLESRCACRRYSSPFPQENRLLLAIPGVTSRFKERTPGMYRDIAGKIAEISDLVPENLICFFPSYDFLSRTVAQPSIMKVGKRVIAERRSYGKNERDAIIASLRRDRDSLLLATIGGSFSEGVDFRDNILSCVIIVGFPISPPSIEADGMRQRMEGKMGRKKAALYVTVYPAVSKVLQASGRAIRDESDRAAIILLDDRYLLPITKSSFPDDFRPIKAVSLKAEVSAFFGKARKGKIGEERSVEMTRNLASDHPSSAAILPERTPSAS